MTTSRTPRPRPDLSGAASAQTSPRRRPGGPAATVIGALALTALLTPAPPALAAPDVVSARPAAAVLEPRAADDPADPRAAESDSITWGVQPVPSDGEPARANYSYDVDRGETIRDSVRITNFSEEPVELDLYASDALTTQSGALDLLPAGEKPKDVGAWIDLERNEVRLDPEESVDVPFTMRVPDNAESGDHTGGVVTSFTTDAKAGDGAPIKLDRRLGSRVYVRVEGPLNPALEVSELNAGYGTSLNPAGKGDLSASWTVTNTGNVRLGADQVLSAAGPLGICGSDRKLDAMPELLPGNSVTLDAAVGAWPTVRSTAEVELTPVPVRPGDNFDDVQNVAASSGTWAVPWMLLALLALLVGGFLGARIARRRRKEREDQRVQAAVTARLGRAPNGALANGATQEGLPAVTPAAQQHGAGQ